MKKKLIYSEHVLGLSYANQSIHGNTKTNQQTYVCHVDKLSTNHKSLAAGTVMGRCV